MASINTQAATIGVATGAYGISFGALAVAGGFSWLQAMAFSLLMFTGASQFAAVAIVATGGAGFAAVLTTWLLGIRNGLYAMSLSARLRPRGWRLPFAAQLTIDESTAMAISHDDPATDDRGGFRRAFWATGIAVFALWNLGTLIGALGAAAVGDPADWGLDAAAPAALLALLWPRLSDRTARWTAAGAVLVAVGCMPLLPPGLPVLASALVALVIGLRRS
ncbi:MAG: AzlC family ABC transporter permease [Actinomycetia bacterium]|nr:AzlC family ABC transporter permease [Actinomycetes bacterium]MCH9801750.1 AzlC family ABC transporter permease [Actinomycetes bacterium]